LGLSRGMAYLPSCALLTYPYALPGTQTPYPGPYFAVGNECCNGCMSNDLNARTLVAFDYTNQLPVGVNVTSIAYSVSPVQVGGLLITNQTLVSNIATFMVSEGFVGQQYILEAVAQLSDGEIWVDKITVTVTDCLATPFVGPGLLYGTAPVIISKTLYYFATSAQTVFNLSTPDFFSSTGVLSNANVLVYLNGSRLVLNVGYSINVGANTITLAFPAALGETIIFDLATPSASSTIQMDALVVVSPNLLPNLTFNTDGNMVMLYYKGLAYFPVGVSPSFSYSGNTLTWLNVSVSLGVGAVVYAVYTHD
jgi:hypothetical protein